ncbi:unnamed protein product [Pleuronectes platessa]|uniref:Uncharacterized protein n=1 Tax=Pleuronectes platessa TaxID=8262 RepID=A0A9N7VW85_PLEPL|nr:unnamed protein product [Pleuronectes platessa]
MEGNKAVEEILLEETEGMRENGKDNVQNKSQRRAAAPPSTPLSPCKPPSMPHTLKISTALGGYRAALEAGRILSLTRTHPIFLPHADPPAPPLPPCKTHESGDIIWTGGQPPRPDPPALLLPPSASSPLYTLLTTTTTPN